MALTLEPQFLKNSMDYYNPKISSLFITMQQQCLSCKPGFRKVSEPQSPREVMVIQAVALAGCHLLNYRAYTQTIDIWVL